METCNSINQGFKITMMLIQLLCHLLTRSPALDLIKTQLKMINRITEKISIFMTLCRLKLISLWIKAKMLSKTQMKIFKKLITKKM